VPAGQTPDPWVTYGWLDPTGAAKPVYAAGVAALAGTPGCGGILGAPAGWPAASTIPPPDVAPACVASALTAAAGAPVAVALPCTDVEGDRLTATVSSPAAHGTVSVSGSTIAYAPEAGFVGDDAFTLDVSDGIQHTSLPIAVSVAAPVAADPLPALLAAVPAALPLSPPAIVVVRAAVVAVARASGTAVLRRGVLAIGVACSAGTGGCRADVAVSARVGHATRLLGRRALALAPGTRATARLPLTRALRRALRPLAGRRLALRVSVAGAGAAQTTIAVRVPL
jgi:hypothetical protein